jgi:hypothetical protein
MISFRVQDGVPVAGRLEYDGTGFDTEPRPAGCVASILVNDLELMISEDDQQVAFVSGYCPQEGWRPTTLTPLFTRSARLFAELGQPLVSGVSIRLTPLQEPWDVSVDRRNGWIRLGASESVTERAGITFAPGAVACLDGNRLIALWLQPKSLHR